jgi:hypothetical protein
MPPITQESGPLTLNRIRVETALSRFPIHRLARKGNVNIDLQRITESGEADFKWEVSYTAKYGQPGPLAYKVDTLIVNRRVDEARRPLPELIKLGSLTDICTEMGMVDSGENRAHIRKALLQNAFAAITAKIRYKTRGGKEKWAEIGYTRYSVIFTGEVLPNGSQADAVYTILNPPYRDLLNQVEMRPLDYDYLRCLPPGSQRFYELASFQVFGAIASGRPRAKMLYSSYCQHAPQTRYTDFDHVKKQMYKVHVPHRNSGYILRVDYQKTVDVAGLADWEMFYTPGPKALAEYRAFSNRQAGTPLSQTMSLRKTPISVKAAPSQASLDLGEANPAAAELIRRGISDKMASELIARLRPGQSVMDQIEYFDRLIASDVHGKLTSPTGFLVSLIRDNARVPEDFPTSARLKRVEREKLVETELRTRYYAYRNERAQRYIETLPARDQEELRQENARLWDGMPEGQKQEMTDLSMFSSVAESGQVEILSFEGWKANGAF